MCRSRRGSASRRRGACSVRSSRSERSRDGVGHAGDGRSRCRPSSAGRSERPRPAPGAPQTGRSTQVGRVRCARHGRHGRPTGKRERVAVASSAGRELVGAVETRMLLVVRPGRVHRGRRARGAGSARRRQARRRDRGGTAGRCRDLRERRQTSAREVGVGMGRRARECWSLRFHPRVSCCYITPSAREVDRLTEESRWLADPGGAPGK